jgi:sugar-specific transcriptional regulator TrmB
MDLQLFLEKIGLEKKEAQCYLALLEGGTDLATNLSNKSGINRSTTHFILNILIEKGLVISEKKGNTFYFTAEPPEKIKFILDKKIDKANEEKNQFEKLLTNFKALESPDTEIPQITTYSGEERLAELFHRLNRECEGEELLGFGTLYFMEKNFPDLIKKNLKEAKYSKARMLRSESIRSKEFITERDEYKINYIVDVRYFGNDEFFSASQIVLSKDYISIVSGEHKNPVGILIKNQYLADNFKNIFNGLWDKSHE